MAWCSTPTPTLSTTRRGLYRSSSSTILLHVICYANSTAQEMEIGEPFGKSFTWLTAGSTAAKLVLCRADPAAHKHATDSAKPRKMEENNGVRSENAFRPQRCPRSVVVHRRADMEETLTFPPDDAPRYAQSPCQETEDPAARHDCVNSDTSLRPDVVSFWSLCRGRPR